jgi:hypothetical protein
MSEGLAFWRITRQDLRCLDELCKWLDLAAQEMSRDEDLELLVYGELGQPGDGKLWFHMGRLDPNAEPEEFGPYRPHRSFCCLFLDPHLPGFLSADPDVLENKDQEAR